jgi:hypothetical protein
MKPKLGSILALSHGRNNFARLLHSSVSSNSNSENQPTALTDNPKVDSILDKSKTKLFEVMSIYEEAIGLKEIKEAQDQVLQVSLFLRTTKKN